MFWFLPMMVLVLLSIPVAFSLGLAGFFGIVVNLNWTAACAFVKAGASPVVASAVAMPTPTLHGMHAGRSFRSQSCSCWVDSTSSRL